VFFLPWDVDPWEQEFHIFSAVWINIKFYKSKQATNNIHQRCEKEQIKDLHHRANGFGSKGGPGPLAVGP